MTLDEAAHELRKTKRWLSEWLRHNPTDKFGQPYYVPMGRTKTFDAQDLIRIRAKIREEEGCPIKLVPPRPGKTPYWSGRGTHFGQYVDRSTKARERALALKIIRRWEREIERGEFVEPGEARLADYLFANKIAEVPKRPSFVYFIECGDFIKIGGATSMRSRLSGLATGNPYQLKVLATITDDTHTESALHNRFAESFHRGEWFRKTLELMAFIAELSKEREAA
jgi:T5orf172 domain